MAVGNNTLRICHSAIELAECWQVNQLDASKRLWACCLSLGVASTAVILLCMASHRSPMIWSTARMPWGRLLPFLLQKVPNQFCFLAIEQIWLNLTALHAELQSNWLMQKQQITLCPKLLLILKVGDVWLIFGSLGWRLVMFWTSPFEHNNDLAPCILMFWGCKLEKRTRNWPRNTWPEREARLLCRPQLGHGAREFHGPRHWPCVKGLSPKPVTSWNQFQKGKQRPKPVPEHRWEIWDV